MKFYAAVLFAAASMFGLSACSKQQTPEAPAAVQTEAQPVVPAADGAAATTTETEAAPAVPVTAPADATK